MLLEFLSPRDQTSFSKQISNVLEAGFGGASCTDRWKHVTKKLLMGECTDCMSLNLQDFRGVQAGAYRTLRRAGLGDVAAETNHVET